MTCISIGAGYIIKDVSKRKYAHTNTGLCVQLYNDTDNNKMWNKIGIVGFAFDQW